MKSWPLKGRQSRVDTLQLFPGGIALNTAVTIAKLGGIRSGLISLVGSDFAGTFLCHRLRSLNVEIDKLKAISTKPTGLCLVFIYPDAERSFISGISTNDDISHETVDLDGINSGDFVHIGGVLDTGNLRHEQLRKLLEKVRQRDVIISVDTSWDETGSWEKGLKSAFPLIDTFITNEVEAQHITGISDLHGIATRIAQRGPNTVIIKLGAEGSYILEPTWEGKVSGFHVQAIDSTGAGDAFSGAFLYGMAQGWGHLQSATFANAVGALCVTKIGATDGITDFNSTIQFIIDQDREGSWNWNRKYC